MTLTWSWLWVLFFSVLLEARDSSNLITQGNEVDLLESVEPEGVDEDNGVHLVEGNDGFSALAIKPSSNIKKPYRMSFTDEFYQSFSVQADFKVYQPSGGFLFAIVEPLEEVVMVGLEVRSDSEGDKETEIVLHLTSTDSSPSQTALRVPKPSGDWIHLILSVLRDSVSLYSDCELLERIGLPPWNYELDSASVIYVGQAGSHVNRHFDGVIKTLKIFGDPNLAPASCSKSFKGFSEDNITDDSFPLDEDFRSKLNESDLFDGEPQELEARFDLFGKNLDKEDSSTDAAEEPPENNHEPKCCGEIAELLRGAAPGPQGPEGEKGESGDTGPVGPLGPPGPKGDAGEVGKPGPPGLPGLPGPSVPLYNDEDIDAIVLRSLEAAKQSSLKGERGEDGDKGETGPEGPQGPPGDEGPSGHHGHKGDRGEKGEAGIDGVPGLIGPKGSQGERGLPGTPGAPSPYSPSGEPQEGVKGERGDVGPTGLPGPPGAQGPEGARGAKGDSGLDGLKGDRGKRGVKGHPGPPGLPGVSRTIAIKGDKGEPGEEKIVYIKGPPGSPGPPGAPGLSFVGEKGEPGEPGYLYGKSTDRVRQVMLIAGRLARPEHYYQNEHGMKVVPGAITFQTLNLMTKMTSATALGTMAYIVEEQAVLVRIDGGWQYVALGSVVRANDEETGYRTTPGPDEAVMQGLPEVLNEQPLTHLPENSSSLRLAALNEVYSGMVGGQRGADFACYIQSRRAGLDGTFRAFLATTIQNLDSLVRPGDRHLPVVNIKGDVLFKSWKSIFSGSGGHLSNSASIYSFSGKDLLTDPTWSEKLVWHGGLPSGERAAHRNCEAWQSDSPERVALASSLFNRKLLSQQPVPCSQRLAVLCIEVTPEQHQTHTRRRRRDLSEIEYYRSLTRLYEQH